jgi:hypothetical protein
MFKFGDSRKGWTPTTLERLGVEFDGGRYVFTVHDHAGEVSGRVRYADDGSKPKMRADAGMARDLWPRPEDVDGTYLVVVEGEPDAVSVAELGFPVVALPGTGKWQVDWPARLAAGRDAVFFVADCDAVGRKRMEDAARKTASMTTACVIDIAPERDDGYDVGDALVDLGADLTRTFLDRLFYDARPVEAPPMATPAKPTMPTPDREIVVTNLATIEPVQLRFLWWPYLPLGKVVIVAGAPGHGKSQLTALMTAMATRADFYPSDVDDPSRVLIMSAEDDLADTIVPRLLAVNADMSRVDTINVRTTHAGGLTAEGMIRIPGDVPTVYNYVKGHPDTRLVILDPVVSFFGREHSSTINQDVRDALDPLVSVAKAYAVTVVVVLHLNKSESRDFTARVAESHGFQALARCVLALGPDPDDPEGERGSKKVLAVTKANLARAGTHALRCEVRSANIVDSRGRPIATSELALTGKCEISADDLLMPATERTARIEAGDWLAEFVGDRWVLVSEVRKAALSDGIAWRTVTRVREAGGYKRAKQPGVEHGPWWMATQDHPGGVPGPGAVGAVGTLQGSNDAKDARAGDTPTAFLDPENNSANGANGANSVKGSKNVTDLDEWRRWEQRRLGERDDDDG